MAQEEGTSQALKEEAMRRENALQQLRTAVKEVRAGAFRVPKCSGCMSNGLSLNKTLNLLSTAQPLLLPARVSWPSVL